MAVDFISLHMWTYTFKRRAYHVDGRTTLLGAAADGTMDGQAEERLVLSRCSTYLNVTQQKLSDVVSSRGAVWLGDLVSCRQKPPLPIVNPRRHFPREPGEPGRHFPPPILPETLSPVV